jgi:fermentation-respiration switch protein FrsA (DUF1100 family)
LAAFTAVTVSLAAIFVLIYLINLQLNVFITPHRLPLNDSPADFGLAYQDVTLTTADGLHLSGWYIPGQKPAAIILVHGIDANRSAVLLQAAMLAEAGFHVLLFDLRAHGLSEGQENTYGYREALDVQAALDYLLAQPGIDWVGGIGVSMGGAVMVRAAAVDPRLRAIVVESSYSSLPEAVDDAFESRSTLPRWPFAPLLLALAESKVGLKIAQVNSVRDLPTLAPRPVLIVHGVEDPLFPVEHARRMYRAAHEPKGLWLVENLGHSSPEFDYPDEYRRRVIGFFEQAWGAES